MVSVCSYVEFVKFSADKSARDVVLRAVELSKTDLRISGNNVVVPDLEMVQLEDLKKSLVGASLNRAKRLSRSISGISLSLQRNKLMHALLIPAYIAATGKFTQNEKISFRKYRYISKPCNQKEYQNSKLVQNHFFVRLAGLNNQLLSSRLQTG